MDSLGIPLTGSGPTYWIDSSSCLVIINYLGNVNSILCVPQGTVLGPILFLLYVNDVDLGACNLYADDTLVYCSANNINELQECTQKCVTAIKEWYDNNRLVTNASQSSIMVVTTKQR